MAITDKRMAEIGLRHDQQAADRDAALDPIDRLGVIIRRQDHKITGLELAIVKVKGEREYLRGERNEARTRYLLTKQKLTDLQCARRKETA